jgi:hypothetical protein
MWPRRLRSKRRLCKDIVIVSGLPRSGTSMMMRMLEAGGMEIVTDHIRAADTYNPYGYYEFEKVKKLKEDASFLDTASGKAVKVISLLLYDLPKDKRYKILFMKRPLEEVLASQKAMLLRQGKPPSMEEDATMKTIFEKHLQDIDAWIPQQENMATLYVQYREVIQDPLKSAQTVNTFLDNRLNVQRMAAVVDERLYRERAFRS